AHPAAAALLEERRHAFLHARRAKHPRIAEFHQHRALGVPRVAPLDAHRTQVAGLPAAGPHRGAFLRSAALISAIAFSMSSSDTRRKSRSVALKSCTSVAGSRCGGLRGTVCGTSATSSSPQASATTERL